MSGGGKAEGARAGDSRPAPPPTPAPLVHLLTSLGEENTRELVGMFLKEFPDKLKKLGSCEREDAHHIAHGLKSTAHHMGASALSRRFAALEERLARPDGKVTPEDLAGIVADFDAVAADLRRYA